MDIVEEQFDWVGALVVAGPDVDGEIRTFM